MYRFEFLDKRVELMVRDRDTFWDPELQQELSPVLKQLQKSGEIAGANVGIKPGIVGLVCELKGRTFQLTYTVSADRKIVKFYEFNQVSHSIDWETALENDLRCSEEKSVYIPQIGDPHKLIKAVVLIGAGTNTPKDLGVAFDSGAKKDKDKIRRGDYIGKPLMALGLAKRVRLEGKSSSIYALTEQGMLIASNSDQETRERLLAESLLGFYPIQVILGETRQDGRPLTKELIQETISKVTSGDCGGTTNPRRASSLRALVNWVTRWAGIAIQRGNGDGVQLYIPNI